MWSRRSRSSLLGLAAAALLAVVVAAVALGQPPRRTPTTTMPAVQAEAIQTGLLIPGMRELRIRLTPQLAQRVTRGKQTADLNALRQSFFMRNNIPHLRLAQGREVKLMPLETLEGKPSRQELETSLRSGAPIQPYAQHLGLAGVQRVKRAIPPATVDHRGKQTPIRDQQDRGTCVAHASMAALEVKYGGGTLDLSEQDAYHIYMVQESDTCCNNDGLQTTNSADYLKSNAVCEESWWPYTNLAGLGCPIANELAHLPFAALNNAKYRVTAFRKIWRNDDLTEDVGMYINNPKYLETLLDLGEDIVFGLHVAGWSGNMKGVLDVQLDAKGNPLPSEGGHAVLIVGYSRPGDYFIAKNSWGAALGQGGYLYLSYDYVRTYSKYGYYISAVLPIVHLPPPQVLRPPGR